MVYIVLNKCVALDLFFQPYQYSYLLLSVGVPPIKGSNSGACHGINPMKNKLIELLASFTGRCGFLAAKI